MTHDKYFLLNKRVMPMSDYYKHKHTLPTFVFDY